MSENPVGCHHGSRDTNEFEGELFIGLVGPIGTKSGTVAKAIQVALNDFACSADEIHVIEEIHKLGPFRHAAHASEQNRYEEHIGYGNYLCRCMESGSALIPLVVKKIHRLREVQSEDASWRTTKKRHAYILRSLKRPEEVEELRALYGPAFFLIAAHAPYKSRVSNLAVKLAGSEADFDVRPYRASAEEFVGRDEQESGEKHGQNVRDTFPKADLILTAAPLEVPPSSQGSPLPPRQ